MAIKLTYEEAVILAMTHCFPERFTDRQIANLLGRPEPWVDTERKAAERVLVNVVTEVLGFRKKHERRAKIAEIIIVEGRIPTRRERANIGYEAEDLLTKASRGGLEQAFEDLEERIRSGGNGGNGGYPQEDT